MRQLSTCVIRDTGRAVVSRKKCSVLAEMFNVDLKFTINTLKSWFEKVIKQRFLEVEYAEKNSFTEKIPLVMQHSVQFAIFFWIIKLIKVG